MTLRTSNAFAIFGHPGHELVVLQWLSDNRAEASCLTDGSGGAMADRTAYSRSTLENAGASVGVVMGECTDKQLYADFLAGDASLLVDMTRKLRDRALELKPAALLTDSFEYFNPVHDIANVMTDIVWRALDAAGVQARKLVYPNEYPDRLKPADATVVRKLSEEERGEKTEAILAYKPLAHEFERLSGQQKLAMLAQECLFEDPVRLAEIPDAADTIYKVAYYEEYGRAKVAEGRYSSLLTVDGHFRPMAAKLVAAFA